MGIISDLGGTPVTALSHVDGTPLDAIDAINGDQVQIDAGYDEFHWDTTEGKIHDGYTKLDMDLLSDCGGATGWRHVISNNKIPSTGKWGVQAKKVGNAASTGEGGVWASLGVCPASSFVTGASPTSQSLWTAVEDSGWFRHNSSPLNISGPFNDGDILELLIDMDAKTMRIKKNGGLLHVHAFANYTAEQMQELHLYSSIYAGSSRRFVLDAGQNGYIPSEPAYSAIMSDKSGEVLSWTEWDEDYETLNVSNCALWMARNTTDMGNEVARSALVGGPNAIITPSSNCAGMVDGYRHITGGIHMTVDAARLLLGSTWTMVYKMAPETGTGNYLNSVGPRSGNPLTYQVNDTQNLFKTSSGANITVNINPGYGGYACGPLWIAMWSNASANTVGWGWSRKRPKVLADFDAYATGALTGGCNFSDTWSYIPTEGTDAMPALVGYPGYSKDNYWAYTVLFNTCIF